MNTGIRGIKSFFTWELGQYGRAFTDDLLLVCQTFEVMDIYRERGSL
ncbi:hypothetical protein PGRAN_14303 [Listeria grandensis FSL F6-0971]|uniref:Uncharacterized protein n=1 Tax=Listeria grandensis FSL F6-0971 TaxID=1265819 RepID=W7B9A8_9LIST|nr:hypothetical protein PGRAN_14303 [Listeria grandensis FSL F6-0971]